MLGELGRRQILSVLLEAGATLNESAMSDDLVDKVRLFYSPKLAFPESNLQKRPASGRKLHGTHASKRMTHYQLTTDRKLSYMSIELFGPDTAVEGYFHDVYG